jgi:hypothetical protein
MGISILLVLEIQRFKSVKACRPKARQAKVNANSSTNSLKHIYCTRYELLKFIGIINSIAAQKINTAAKHRLPFCKKMNF